MKLWRMFSSFLVNSFFVLNWMGFVWISFVMASGKHGLSVFLTLPWGSFLTELSSISPQGHVDSGSVWIAWLILNLAYSGAMLGRQHSPHKASNHTQMDVASLVKNKRREIESDPELQQSLNKLNQLLKNSWWQYHLPLRGAGSCLYSFILKLARFE